MKNQFLIGKSPIWVSILAYLAPEEVIDLNFGHTEPRGNF